MSPPQIVRWRRLLLMFCWCCCCCSWFSMLCVGSISSRFEGDYSSCCADVFGPCKEACENFSLVHYAAATSDTATAASSHLHHQHASHQHHSHPHHPSDPPPPPTPHIQQLANIRRACPPSLDAFWSCHGRHVAAVSRGYQWTGRHCCTLGISARCRYACAMAASGDEVAQACRHSDEPALFGCVQRQRRAYECCGQARTAACMQQCQTVLLAGLRHAGAGSRRSGGVVNGKQRARLEEVCSLNDGGSGAAGTESFSRVLRCVSAEGALTTQTQSESFVEYAACCDKSPISECQQTCHQALQHANSTQQIIDVLEAGGCGPPLPHDPLWQCFIASGKQTTPAASSSSSSSSSFVAHASTSSFSLATTMSSNRGQTGNAADAERSRINQIGMDAAKLHCCHQAATSKCRRLCLQTFANDWTRTRADFERECITFANAEPELRQCLEEVDEPCELGCSGLQYCHNFNARPTQLFRACNAPADSAARAEFAAWQRDGHVNLTTLLSIPIRNVSACLPAAWQTIVCTLQIRPCARRRHTTRICRADCLDVLSRCLDVSRALPVGHSAESICALISPPSDDDPCIRLSVFAAGTPADEAALAVAAREVRFPCAPDPCAPDEVCEVVVGQQTDGRRIDEKEPVYHRCVPACRLGETSTFRVAVGRYVRVPVHGAAAGRLQSGCHKVCKCSADGRIEQCQPLPCITYEACMMAGRRIEHASSIALECNVCSCFAGEITCTKRQCRMPGLFAAPSSVDPAAVTDSKTTRRERLNGKAFTSLPCNCPAHYVPVCGRNGQTFPSLCVAKCAGLPEADVEFGACQVKTACANVTCPGNGRCVPMRQVCLSVMQKPCVQYICVNDSNGISAINQASIELATTPHCPSAVDDAQLINGTVCGINGVTYPSECHARGDHSLPDYAGECRQFGRLSNAQTPTTVCSPINRCAATLACPAGVPVVHPPGACCAICAGAMRVMYSRKQIDRALYALPARDQHLMTQQGVLSALQRLIRTARCRVFGYLTVEADLFVAVQMIDEDGELQQPVTNGMLAVACAREAEKLFTLIATQSAQIASDVSLSALIGAQMMDTVVDGWGDDAVGTVDGAAVDIIRSCASMRYWKVGLLQGLAYALSFYSRAYRFL